MGELLFCYFLSYRNQVDKIWRERGRSWVHPTGNYLFKINNKDVTYWMRSKLTIKTPERHSAFFIVNLLNTKVAIIKKPINWFHSKSIDWFLYDDSFSVWWVSFRIFRTYSRLFTADLEHVKAGWRMCYKVATINYVLVKSKSSLCAVQTLLLLYSSKDTFPYYQIRIWKGICLWHSWAWG